MVYINAGTKAILTRDWIAWESETSYGIRFVTDKARKRFNEQFRFYIDNGKTMHGYLYWPFARVSFRCNMHGNYGYADIRIQIQENQFIEEIVIPNISIADVLKLWGN